MKAILGDSLSFQHCFAKTGFNGERRFIYKEIKDVVTTKNEKKRSCNNGDGHGGVSKEYKVNKRFSEFSTQC